MLRLLSSMCRCVSSGELAGPEMEEMGIDYIRCERVPHPHRRLWRRRLWKNRGSRAAVYERICAYFAPSHRCRGNARIEGPIPINCHAICSHSLILFSRPEVSQPDPRQTSTRSFLYNAQGSSGRRLHLPHDLTLQVWRLEIPRKICNTLSTCDPTSIIQPTPQLVS